MDKTYVVLTDMWSVDLNLDHINIRNMMIFPLCRNEAFDLPSPLEYQHYSNKAFFTLALRVHVFCLDIKLLKICYFYFSMESLPLLTHKSVPRHRSLFIKQYIEL